MITYPAVQVVRVQFDSFTTNENLITDNKKKKCVLWGYSDIPYLQHMTDPTRVEESMQWGIYFSKIGSKITEIAQPLDLGPFFNILKSSGWNCTSGGQPTALSLKINVIFAKLSKIKQLVLATGRGDLLRDCITTAPEMISNLFTQRTIQKSFVESAMLDDKSKLFPDLRGIINSFKVNWKRVPGGRNWLMKMIPQAMEEMFKNSGSVRRII